MTPQRPYLLRAFYDWILDNDLTPYLVVDAEFPGAMVPMQFVKDGQIVLNIAPSATQGLTISDDGVEFNARFSGKVQRLYVPCGAALALYAKENGEGTAFAPEKIYDEQRDNGLVDEPAVRQTEEPNGESEPQPKKPGKPTLTVVK